jgi:hypothetical protein
MGNSTATSAAKKSGMRNGRNRKAYSSFYTNADAQSGDCKVTSSSRGLTHEDGTVTYRKGSSIVKFTSDGGSSFIFSLRSMISEGLSRGAWVITIP